MNRRSFFKRSAAALGALLLAGSKPENEIALSAELEMGPEVDLGPGCKCGCLMGMMEDAEYFARKEHETQHHHHFPAHTHSLTVPPSGTVIGNHTHDIFT